MKQTPSSSISSIRAFGIVLLFLFFVSPQAGLPASKLDDYLAAFKDKHVNVRRAAIEQLLACITDDDTPMQAKKCPEGGGPDAYNRLLTAIIDLLADSDPKVRETAVFYLKQTTDARVIKPIARLLRDVNTDVRAAAVESFYLIKVDSVTVQELERLLMDKNKRVRMGAASSLGLNGTKKSLGLLRGALAREADNELRELYAQIIQELENRFAKKSTGNRKMGKEDRLNY